MAADEHLENMREMTSCMAAARLACPEIFEAIDRAGAAGELNRIAREEILPAKGISDQVQLGLQAALDQRFAALNAAHLKKPAKPRWS